MTANERFERDLPELIADLYLESAPDYRHDIVQRIAASRQRPAWTFPERWLPMGVMTLSRQTLRPVPWRTIVLLTALALLLAVALAAYVGSQRSVPPPFGPAANGTLVVGEGGDIFLIDPGTGARILAIGGPTTDSEPVFSRDGRQFAFYREDGGQRGLFVADEHGQGARELSTTGLVNVNAMDWSPDGRSILVSGSDGGRSTVAVIPVDGGAARVLDLGMPAEDAVWLPPDGREILFRTPGVVGFGLAAARPDGSGVRTLVPATGAGGDEFNGLFFAPSPDGSQVAYQWRNTASGVQEILVVPISGGTSQPLTTIESVGPRWSPDGTRISFFSDDGVYVVSADASAPPAQTQMLPLSAPPGWSQWAPDGTYALFIRPDGRPLLLDPTGGPPVEPSWSVEQVDADGDGAPDVVLPDWQRLAPTP